MHSLKLCKKKKKIPPIICNKINLIFIFITFFLEQYKNYKFLSWVETSLQKSQPELDNFLLAEKMNDTKEATNTSYKDLLLTLQQKQSNKLTSIARNAEN